MYIKCVQSKTCEIVFYLKSNSDLNGKIHAPKEKNSIRQEKGIPTKTLVCLKWNFLPVVYESFLISFTVYQNIRFKN